MDRVAVPVLSVVILLAGWICTLQVFHQTFDHDEFQHSHMAWLIGQGEILYKDFFDHHGPLFSILNGFAIHTFSLDRAVSTLFVLRLLSLFFSLGTAWVTYWVSLHLFGDRKKALCSVAFLVTAYFFVDKGSEIRPDTLQSLGWMLGLYFLLRAGAEPSGKNFFGAGLFFGLAILANVKVALGVAVAIPFFCLFTQLGKERLTAVMLRMGIILTGLLLPFILITGYFVWHDALYEFYYSNTVFNLELMRDEFSTQKRLGGIFRNSTLIKFGKENWSLAFFALVGLLQLLDLRSRKSEDNEVGQETLFLVSVTLCTSALAFMPFYSQIYLIFLPLGALLAGYALIRLTEQIPRVPRVGVFMTLVLVAFLPVLKSLLSAAPFTETERLRAQIDRSQYIVEETAYEEPVAHVWNGCGGYVFNKSPGYFWYLGPAWSGSYVSFKGYDNVGAQFVKALEERDVRFIVASKGREFDGLTLEARTYIEANYSYSDCLFTRH